MNLAEHLQRSARQYPDAPAVLHGSTVLFDYRALAQRTASLASALLQKGLQPGDRVALYMSNCPSYLELLYAVWWAGLVAVPINAKLHAREALFILQNAEVAGLCVSADLADALLPLTTALSSLRITLTPDTPTYSACLQAPAAALHPCAPNDMAWLFYTSGTTGQPKGVMLTHANLHTMSACYFSDVDSIDPHDAIVYAAPMSHGAGIYALPHVMKAARHVVPLSGGFEPSELCTLAQSVGHLSFFAAPTMVKRLVEHIETSGAAVEGFKTIVYGGGPMYVADIQKGLQVMGPRFVQIYGQGECPMTITALSRQDLADTQHPHWAVRIGSVGVAQSQVEVQVVDTDGGPVAEGVTGEIIVRGSVVMAGYWRNPDATAKALRDGWLWTGDMGSLDAYGYLTLKDRSKDVIISGGSNIYPREVEEVLLQHPAVFEVSVIGQPDAEWGEVVIAFIAPHAEYCSANNDKAVQATLTAALDKHCLEHIARFKRPKNYHFVEALPKNNYGKILKTALREKLLEK